MSSEQVNDERRDEMHPDLDGIIEELQHAVERDEQVTLAAAEAAELLDALGTRPEPKAIEESESRGPGIEGEGQDVRSLR